MRTTIILDESLARRAKQAAVRRGITLSDLISESLRRALSEPVVEVPPFVMPTHGAGLPPARHEPADFAALQDEEDRRSLEG